MIYAVSFAIICLIVIKIKEIYSKRKKLSCPLCGAFHTKVLRKEFVDTSPKIFHNVKNNLIDLASHITYSRVLYNYKMKCQKCNNHWDLVKNDFFRN